MQFPDGRRNRFSLLQFLWKQLPSLPHLPPGQLTLFNAQLSLPEVRIPFSASLMKGDPGDRNATAVAISLLFLQLFIDKAGSSYCVTWQHPLLCFPSGSRHSSQNPSRLLIHIIFSVPSPCTLQLWAVLACNIILLLTDWLNIYIIFFFLHQGAAL